jgi:HD superfamily phosphohydrolase
MYLNKLLKTVFVICSSLAITAASLEVKTLFGALTLQEELLKVYQIDQMQRLKAIDLSGTAYWNSAAKFSRLEHSLNKLWLVRHYGGDIKEQIAALVSDIAYPAFAQTSDVIFGVKNYPDTIQEWFLNQTAIAKLMVSLDLAAKDILADNPEFKRLKQPLPDMCADQIAFCMRGAIASKILKPKQIKQILAKIRFEDGKWFFTSRKQAKKFANLTIKLTTDFWGVSDDLVAYHITGLILKRGLQLQRITTQDLNFLTEQQILDKLNASGDPKIKHYIAKAKFIKKTYRILKDGEGTPDFVPKPKFLAIDPWVYNKHTQKFTRLSKLDKEFATKFEKTKEWCAKGFKIQLQIN